MRILGLDFGSSSLKGAILKHGQLAGKIARARYATRYNGVRAEVNPKEILRALRQVIQSLGSAVTNVDVIALSVMSPAWVVMDHEGRPLTPIITHQDRRSVAEAKELERRMGKARYLKLAGNRPVPGGISCTSWAWFLRHEPALMKKADLCGHLNTFLHRQLTEARIIDPSNASFTGFYETTTLKGWNDELMAAAGIQPHRLPQVIGSSGIGGFVTHAAAERFGLRRGSPVLAGCVDTSAAMLLSGARTGQLLNVSGSTDVLALCMNTAVPHENLLTRALGVARKWMSVATIAAAGTSLDWARRELFADLSDKQFWKLLQRTADVQLPISDLKFEPYLAGERTGIEQRSGTFTGLTLATTRNDMLRAIIDGLARTSARRLEILSSLGTKIRRDVVTSGGVERLGALMQRNWRGRWRFRHEDEATLRGLARLAD